MVKLIWIVCIPILLNFCEGYKILVAYPFPVKSHNILGNGFVRHLLQGGHEVTYITPFPLANPHPRLRQIDVSKNYFDDEGVNIQSFLSGSAQTINDETLLFRAIIGVVNMTFQHEHVKQFLSDPKEEFDVVVAEWMFNEVYSGLGVVFNCPFIWTVPYEPYVITLRLLDGPPNPAYIPNLGSNNVAPFSFLQRVQELWSQLNSLYLKDFSFYYKEKEVYENSFRDIVAKRGQQLPSYDEVRFKASMILSSTHVSLGEAVTLPQNFKSIAGYFIEDKVKPLPDELKKIMDNAKDGVIYFSMGSNLKSKDLSDSIKKQLLKMFSERKETVIWKFEDNLADLPENVHIYKWAPQQSILAHPNCKLFLTHGGLLSMTETVHFGIPIIGIPVYCDQFNNVDRAVVRGCAKRVELSFSLADDLGAAIEEVLGNPKYARKAKEMSVVYHDRPVSPGAELVHWVEHVVRTRGAPHLRSPAMLLPWYQKLYLDLAALILLILLLVQKLISKAFSKKKVIKAKKIN